MAPKKTPTWDGTGDPPSHEAALAWLRSQGWTEAELKGPSGSGIARSKSGSTYRRMNNDRLRRERMSTPEYKAKVEDSKTTRSKPRSSNTQTKADTNKDGQIDTREAATYTAAGGDLDDILAAINNGPAASNDKGAALWPYEGDPLAMGDITVVNKSQTKTQKYGQRIGARYHEADTWRPLRWSEEERADVQRKMFNLGLYGDNKVRLGVWTATDQAVYTELLTAANVEGRTMKDQLTYWMQVPPVELLSKIKGEQPAKPTIRVTDPIDIRAAAGQVAQQISGGGDTQFMQDAVADYQAVEAGRQQQVISDQDASGGGTVADAPGLQNYLADKLRREQPLNVAGQSMLRVMDQFINMLGSPV